MSAPFLTSALDLTAVLVSIPTSLHSPPSCSGGRVYRLSTMLSSLFFLSLLFLYMVARSQTFLSSPYYSLSRSECRFICRISPFFPAQPFLPHLIFPIGPLYSTPLEMEIHSTLLLKRNPWLFPPCLTFYPAFLETLSTASGLPSARGSFPVFFTQLLPRSVICECLLLEPFAIHRPSPLVLPLRCFFFSPFRKIF